VLICKKTGTSKEKDGCIGAEDVAHHLAIGDILGSCGSSAQGGKDNVSNGKTELSSYPNPFANRTTLSFTIPQEEKRVTLEIFDAAGNRVVTLYSGQAEANVTRIFTFNSARLAAGFYFAKLTTSKGTETIKLIVAK
jgi:hypothetical protein